MRWSRICGQRYTVVKTLRKVKCDQLYMIVSHYILTLYEASGGGGLYEHMKASFP